MKKFIIAAFGFLVAANAFADCQTHKTVPLSTWYKSGGGNFNVWVSNRSSHDVEISITLFRTNGTTYTESTESGSNISTFGSFTTSPVENNVTLLPRNTGRIRVNNIGSEQFGYAVLTWSSEECLSNPLSVSTSYSDTTGRLDWNHLSGEQGI